MKSESQNAPSKPPRCCWGLFNRKERWGLSWRGWLLLFTGTAGVCVGYLLVMHPFLAVTARVNTDVMVVEGWMHKYSFEAAAQEFKTGGYRRVFSTGGPVPGLGHYVNDFQTVACVGADQLKAAGIPEAAVEMTPSRVMTRDRTFGAAVALRNWLRDHGQKVTAINVVTEDAHARRTRLLFQTAFGDGVSVGVISVASPDYDSRRWWCYSEGVREVLGETIAYVYARFMFHPSTAERANGAVPAKS